MVRMSYRILLLAKLLEFFIIIFQYSIPGILNVFFVISFYNIVNQLCLFCQKSTENVCAKQFYESFIHILEPISRHIYKTKQFMV